MIDLSAILAERGLDVASSAIYDVVRRYLSEIPTPTVQGLEHAVRDVIASNGYKISASTIVSVLAKTGAIVISNSTVYAPKAITYRAQDGSRVIFGGTGRSATDKPAIISQGRNAAIHLEGMLKFVITKMVRLHLARLRTATYLSRLGAATCGLYILSR